MSGASSWIPNNGGEQMSKRGLVVAVAFAVVTLGTAAASYAGTECWSCDTDWFCCAECWLYDGHEHETLGVWPYDGHESSHGPMCDNCADHEEPGCEGGDHFAAELSTKVAGDGD